MSTEATEPANSQDPPMDSQRVPSSEAPTADAGTAMSNPKLQLELVARLIDDDEAQGLIEGNYYHVLVKTWFSSWKQYVRNDGERPGAIDNSSLLEENGQVRPRLTENVDFVIISEKVWSLFADWFGGGPVIRRRCVAASYNRRLTSVELRPLCVKVIRSSDVKKTVPVFISKAASVQEFLDEARKMMDFDPANIRIFDFHNGNKLKELTKLSHPLDDFQILDQQLMLIEEKKRSGRWPKDGIYKYWSQKGGSSHYSNRAPTEPGRTGLVNIGNTCFMNSALQCLGAAVPLVDHFMERKYRPEINMDNVLGTKGELAEAYYSVLTELWSSRTAVCDPRDFKRALAKFAPQFTGYNQQDSQELMTFLLDGLNECLVKDLNRIRKKPYVESKDSNGRPDDAVAAEAWAGYTARNDSVIVDNFMGLLKSTLTCPVNNLVAVKFDPFMFLTLQLPVDNSRRLKFTFHFSDPSKLPRSLSVSVNKDGYVKEAKQALAAAVGITDYRRIALMDLFKGYFYAEFDDKDEIAAMKDSDDVHAYEIDFSEPSKAEPESGQPPVETVHVVVLNRKAYKSSKDLDLFGVPMVLSVPRTITYRQLYATVATRLQLVQKEPISSEIELEQSPADPSEEPKPTGEAASDDFDAIANRPGRDKYYEEVSNRWVVNSIPKEPMFGGAFTLIPVSNRGIEKTSLFANNDRPLHLKEKEHVALLWTMESKKKYIDMPKWKVVELDPSAVAQETASSSSSGRRRGADALPLSECLRLYSVQEQLGEEDKWYCPDCKEHVQAFKKIEVWSAPRILIVHLKRFNYRGRYHFRDRLDNLVEFPLENLDMSQYVLGPKDIPPIYDLFAVSNHYGSMGGGHYTAYARHRDDGKWYLYDDSSVREVSDLSSIVSEAAYMLLYRRRDIPWPAFNRASEAAESEDEDTDEADSDDEPEVKPAAVAPLTPAPTAAAEDAAPSPAAGAGAGMEVSTPLTPASGAAVEDAPELGAGMEARR